MNKTKQTNGRIKICFVALSAYPLLAGKSVKRIIGPDVHTTLLAKELLKHNFEITFITYSDGGAPVEYIDGIKVIKTYTREDHLNKVLKAFCIWKAMKNANAPIYYHHGGAAGIVSIFCKVMGRKLVWHIAHDKLVTRKQEYFAYVDRLSSWLDIKLAFAIIAQSEIQRVMLNNNFGKDSVVIKNHFPLTEQGMSKKAKPPIVLWVGTMAMMKQPELYMKLAKAIPEATFLMIGGPSVDQEHYSRLKENAKIIPNLDFLGFIKTSDINDYFSQAAIFVNTAESEGFPYAFIQAWMNHTPVISLHSDPDEIICKYKMGFHSNTFDQLVKDTKTLLKNKKLREEMGVNGRIYVEREHDITKIINKHIDVFEQTLWD